MRPDFALPASAAEALGLLYQHRLLSTSQVHELLTTQISEMEKLGKGGVSTTSMATP